MTRGFRARLRAALIAATAAGLLVSGAGSASAITGGGSVNDGGFAFVAKLLVGDTERACSGVLVHPQVVLTAAACFADAQGAVRAGEPASYTTATVGRTDVAAGTGGTVSQVVDVVAHPERDLALARLDTPATAAPIPIATTAPEAGETLTIAGFGRTATEWVPGRLKYARAAVDTVTGGTLTLAGGSGTAGVCKGDAGGPAFRESGGTVELVALHHDSNQAGCYGEATGAPRATETRLDDVRSWIIARYPGFATTLEAGQPSPNWQNSVNTTGPGAGGIRNVGGVCCSLPGPELFVGTDARAHSGDKVLLYSGKDNDATTSFAYTKAYKLKNAKVRASSVLSYWIYPQSKANSYGHADGNNSTCVAVDLTFTEGRPLRDLVVTDQRGHRAHPAAQCDKMPLDTWTQVVVPIGTVAEGRQIATLSIAYDQGPNTGGYRGFVDDITITDLVLPPTFATAMDGAPTWANTVSDTAPGGGLLNVGGVCCSLTGPELFTGTDPRAHSGDKVLLYSGKDNSATRSYAYTKAFQLADTFVTPTTRLSYWIYPQSKGNSYGYAEGNNSSCVAVDLILLSHWDNSKRSLRDAGVVDQRGNSAHPGGQCGKLTLDKWNYVTVPLGAVANGKEIIQIDVGYDQSANTGGYRGFIDDIRITH